MDKIQKIKQEIERIKKEVYNHNFAIDYSANGALDRVVRFIDSLPEKSGCEIDFTAKDEDLEEELYSWIRENCDDDGFFNQLELARHFAEWGRTHK